MPLNEHVRRITQLAKLGFNHSSVVLTADVFHFFIRDAHEDLQVTGNTQPFGHILVNIR